MGGLNGKGKVDGGSWGFGPPDVQLRTLEQEAYLETIGEIGAPKRQLQIEALVWRLKEVL